MAHIPSIPPEIGQPTKASWANVVSGDINDLHSRVSYIEATNDGSHLPQINEPVTIHISTTGDDNLGDGESAGTAFATLQKALNVLQGRPVASTGSLTIQFQEGTYQLPPTVIRDFRHLRLQGDVSDPLKVRLEFDLSALEIPTPVDVIDQTACLFLSDSFVTFSDLEIRKTANAVINWYGIIAARNSAMVFEDCYLQSTAPLDQHAALVLRHDSLFSVQVNKRLDIKAYSAINMTGSSGGPAGDSTRNGELHMVATTPGSGTAMSIGAGSRCDTGHFSAWSETDFGVETYHSGTSTIEESIHFSITSAGDFKYVTIPEWASGATVDAFMTTADGYGRSSYGSFTVRRSDMAMKGYSKSADNENTDMPNWTVQTSNVYLVSIWNSYHTYIRTDPATKQIKFAGGTYKSNHVTVRFIV